MPPDAGLSPDAMTAEFRRAIEQARTGIGQIVESFNSIVEKVHDWGLLAGGAVLLWAKEKLDEFRTKLVELVGKAQHMVEHSTPIVSLIITSFEWLERVQKPATGVAGQIAVKGDRLVYWKGAAAETYGAKLPFQQAATSDMAAKADFISTWLFTIAKANVDYARSLGSYVSEIAGGLISAAATATTVIGIPWAIDQLAKIVGGLVTKALDDTMNMASRLVEVLKSARDAKASVNNVEKLAGPPVGTWPQAVNVV
ncbi:hypothetical protein [Actinoplanes sp. NBRC 103695]|uniref:hypothetical protein n=1 Tax=Actinoplanes sp. NBRC 103695 TaxID=3032202 RepID=UPI0025579EDD|nr:hypothetical protein [Actinoplanes sp. NBRC 103695]GLY99333.1 hypothetical protein Acsp02_65860 [Actinoplanes sp. NBRC 103695]